MQNLQFKMLYTFCKTILWLIITYKKFILRVEEVYKYFLHAPLNVTFRSYELPDYVVNC